MSLTDDWKAGKLKCGLYWVICKGNIVVAECRTFGDISEAFKVKTKNDFMVKVSEVLAPCDYEELQWLKECVDALRQDYINLREKKKIEINNLRQLLGECKGFIDFVDSEHPNVMAKKEDLLTRISGALK